MCAVSVLATAPQAQIPTRNMSVLSHRNDFGVPGAIGYSSCWGYVHSDGREYAAIGCLNGTAIYRLTDPDNPVLVGFIDGPFSYAREMKSYRDWIYVVADVTGPGQGVQVIRMTNPDAPVLAATFVSDFVRTHTVEVDTTRALLYCNGARNTAGSEVGLRILSLANPEAPVQVGRWPATPFPPHEQYVHDGVPFGNLYFASSLYGGQRAIDVSNPAAPTQISNWLYPGAFSHSCWPDATGRWLYVCDEMTSRTMKVFDLLDLMNPVQVYGLTPNPDAMVHNPRVHGEELFVSSYTEGVRIYDLSDPGRPAEFAWADTYLGGAGGYNGAWEVCPYFPSGILVASDRQSGLWVLEPQRDYGLVEVSVRDADADTALANAQAFCSATADSVMTPADGVVRFAPSPGSTMVSASKFGWMSKNAIVNVSQGGLIGVTLELMPLPTGYLAGWVHDASTNASLEEAEISLGYTPLNVHSNSVGDYLLEGIPTGNHLVRARAPGHAGIEFVRFVGPGPQLHDFQLRPAAIWDPLEQATAWTIGAPGDDATSGLWIRVEPLGTGEPGSGEGTPQAARAEAAGSAPPSASESAPGPGLLHEEEGAAAYPGEAQPEYDRTPGSGQMCYVTGQGTDPIDVRQADLDGGRTTLTTPSFDLTGMAEPTLAWWQWFYTDLNDGDWLAVLISGNNGASWMPVDTVLGFGENHWHEHKVRVADYVVPGPNVRLRFVAADDGYESVVEAAIDDLIAYDAALPLVGVPGEDIDGGPMRGATLRFARAWPNPARESMNLTVEIPKGGHLDLRVFDIAGREVRVLHRGRVAAGSRAVRWDGRDARGVPVPVGIYTARAQLDEQTASVRAAWVR